MFVALLEPKIQSELDRLLPTPAHQSKAVGTNESLRGLYCFIKNLCLYVSFYPMLIACLINTSLINTSLINTSVYKFAATLEKKPNQQYIYVCAVMVPFHVGYLILYGCL